MQRMQIGTLIAGLAGLLAGQTLLAQRASKPAPGAAPSAAVASKKWRTPWGDPDLQGTWSNATTTPLERPAKYGDRAMMTKEEIAAENKETENRPR